MLFYHRSCFGLYVVTQWLQLKTWLIDYPREGVKCLISIPGGRKSTYPCYLFDNNTIDIFLNFWILSKNWLGDSLVFVALTCLALTIASLGIALLWPFCGIHCYTRQNTANGKKRHITPRDLKKSDFQIFRKRFFWRNFVSKFAFAFAILKIVTDYAGLTSIWKHQKHGPYLQPILYKFCWRIWDHKVLKT